ncbi:MAG: protein translocase subunit SecD [Spirochaetota bacterium]|nr:protein translocase subunit SecD [Spirochaetota bacterium]
MEIVFNPDASSQDYDSVEKRFSSDNFFVKRNENDKIVTVEGVNLNDAIMNEARILPGVRDARILPHWAEETFLAKTINLGLDLQGGMHLVLRANFKKIEKKLNKELNESEKDEITQQALELLRNRIDKFGVSEPSIRPRGNEAIEIQLPGVKNPKSVKKVIGTTGSVEYRLVNDEYSKKANDWIKENYKEERLPIESSAQINLLLKVSRKIDLPRKYELLFFYIRDKETKKIFPSYIVALLKKVSLAGNDISKAWVGQDEYGRLAVHFTTTPDGATKFSEVTSEKNHGKKLAIVIDDKVRSAPQLNVQINTGKALIEGDFTRDEVETIARIIKEGALPVDLEIIEERTVGPSLGQDSIDAGIKAIIIGLVGVMIFMIYYYKLAGIIADLGLVLNMIFMLALLSWLGFTLTLPGIAGFILTVGMAVDANVIIYERIKEELRSGKSARMSVSNGFDRAFWTIFDANITTLIAAFILSQFGTGPIKGFAVTLFIGIICSMFVALYITRFIYEIITSNKKIKRISI